MISQITSRQHPLVKRFVKLRENRSYRYSEGRVIVEGRKLLRELSAIKRVFAVDRSLLAGIESDEIFLVSQEILEKASGTKNPEGIIAEMEMPPYSLEGLATCCRVIAFDGINDPGNLGTLLRTALALGWDGAYIFENSCDPFNEKALRAARGATFRLPIAIGTGNQLQAVLAVNHWTPFVADIDGVNPEEVKTYEKLLLIMGNEARGPSKEVKSFCQSVSIPMPGSMESLNVSVAGGILMYLLRF